MNNFIHIDRFYDWTGEGAGSVEIGYEKEDYVASVHLSPKLEDDENTFALELLCDCLIYQAWIAEGRDPAKFKRLETMVL